MYLIHQTSLGGALNILESGKMSRVLPPYSAEFLLVPAEARATDLAGVAKYHGTFAGSSDDDWEADLRATGGGTQRGPMLDAWLIELRLKRV